MQTKTQDCLDCEGSGWTEEGWNKAQADSGFCVENPFAGDCQKCKGTGQITPTELELV